MSDEEGKPIIRDERGRIAKGSGSLHPGGHYAESAQARKDLAKYVGGSIETLGKIATREDIGVEVPVRVIVEAAKFIVERFVPRADSEVQGGNVDDNLRAIRELLSLTPKN